MKTNKWRLAVLVWAMMFPFSTAVSYGLAQVRFMADCPLVVRTFLLTCCLVPYMVFGALPFLNRRFRPWLTPKPDAAPPAPTPMASRPQKRLASRRYQPGSAVNRNR